MILPQKRVNTLSSQCQDYFYNHKCVTDQAQDDQDQQTNLLQRVHLLQEKLSQAKIRQNKLKTINTQLSNMLASSKQANIKKSLQFIKKIEAVAYQKMRSTSSIHSHSGRFSSKSKEQQFQIGNNSGKTSYKHQKKWSNYDTSCTLGQDEYKQKTNYKQNKAEILNGIGKNEIKQRVSSIRRMQKQLKNFKY